MSRAMKNSGIPWIGQIPEYWGLASIKNLSSILNGYAFDSNDFRTEGEMPVIRIGDIQNGVISSENILYVNRRKALDNFIAYKNDLLIAMSGATVGKTGIVNEGQSFYVNQRVGIIRSQYIDFVKRIFETTGFNEYVLLSSLGSAQPNISSNGIANFKITVPPLSEQQQIADYLDTKCAEVDELIALQEKMIDELKVYKQSVITEAVTKGLNPDAPLKDSGIEWIGQIPEYWELARIKNISSILNGYAFDSNDFKTEGEIPVIRIGDIQNGVISSENILYVSRRKILDNFIAYKNDLLIAMSGATVGKTGIVNDGQSFYVNQRVGIIRSQYIDFVKRIFETTGFNEYVLLSSLGSAQPNISSNGIANFKITVPPLSEQQQIADYLDTKCAEIDEMTSIKQQKIEQLKEYKKSIIYEYVTGKKQVNIE